MTDIVERPAATGHSVGIASAPLLRSVGMGMFRAVVLALACAVTPCAHALAAALIIQNVSGATVEAVHVVPIFPGDKGPRIEGRGPNRLEAALPHGDHTVIDLTAFGDPVCSLPLVSRDSGMLGGHQSLFREYEPICSFMVYIKGEYESYYAQEVRLCGAPHGVPLVYYAGDDGHY